MDSAFQLEKQNSNIESRIVVALERIAEVFRILLWNESKKYGLTPIQVQVLIFLLTHSEEQCTVSYLANEFNLTKATISDAVKSLGKKNLLVKQIVKSDSRSSLLILTKKGKEIAQQAASFASVLEKSLESISADDKESLLFSLILVIHHFTESGIISLQRMCFTCSHYRKQQYQHYCTLLNMTMQPRDLRIDCPEHTLQRR